MSFEIIDPTKVPNWDTLILSHPSYSFFHSSAWARVLSQSYGYKPVYFTIFNGDKISSCLPLMEVDSFITGKRGVCLPFTDYCEPLVHDLIQFEALLAHVRDYGKKAGWKYIELRGSQVLPGNTPASMTYLGHTLDLTPGETALFEFLRDSTRRNIKKARKEGVEITVSNSMEAARTFHHLNQITRRHHGLPPQPWSFFCAIHQHVLATGLGFVVLASYQGKAIASSVFFHFGGKGIYKYGASALEFQQVRANNLVMWKAIEQMKMLGLKTLSFGRTDIDHNGLRQFKTGWGAEEYDIKYYRHDLREDRFVMEASQVNGFSKMIFARLPTSVLNLIGSLAYRHMG